MVSERIKSFSKQLILAIILTVIIVSISVFLGLGRGGFDNATTLQTFFFYISLGIPQLVGIVLIAGYLTLVSKGNYGESLAFNSPGEFPSVVSNKYRSSFKLFLLSAIIFSIAGIFAVTQNKVFTGVGTLPQQFKIVDSLLYSSALIPGAENIGAAFFAAAFLLGWISYCKRNSVQRGSYRIGAYIIFILSFGIYGGVNHLLRYSNSDLAIFTVIIFWSIGGLLTITTGSFIPFWVMHIANNLFADITTNFSKNISLTFAITVVIVSTIIYAILYGRKKEK